jgi:hypothetical protein
MRSFLLKFFTTTLCYAAQRGVDSPLCRMLQIRTIYDWIHNKIRIRLLKTLAPGLVLDSVPDLNPVPESVPDQDLRSSGFGSGSGILIFDRIRFWFRIRAKIKNKPDMELDLEPEPELNP